MKFILGIILSLTFLGIQDKPAELPEKITLTKEQTKQIADSQKDAQLAALQVENLTLKIQQAQEELKKLQEAAGQKQKSLTSLLTGLTKLPVEKLQGYTIEEKDGQMILTKKKE